MLVNNKKEFTQYIFKYSDQKGAYTLKERITGFSQKTAKSDDILAKATDAPDLFLSMAIDLEGVPENKTIKELRTDPNSLSALSSETEINHQMINKIKRKYGAKLEIISQRKNVDDTDSYDEYGTTQVDLGLIPKQQIILKW